jgi:hypothetical protein
LGGQLIGGFNGTRTGKDFRVRREFKHACSKLEL